MDTLSEAIEAPLFELERTGDDHHNRGWAGIGSDAEGTEDFWDAFESRGTLLTRPPRWSISTEPGEEGLHWGKVKPEFFCGLDTIRAPGEGTCNTIAGTPSKPPPASFSSAVKEDPDTWTASVATTIGAVTRPTACAEEMATCGESGAATLSPAGFQRRDGPRRGAPSKTSSAARRATRSGGSSAPPQRSSSRTTAAKKSKSAVAAIAAAAAGTPAPAPDPIAGAVVPKTEEDDDDIDEDDIDEQGDNINSDDLDGPDSELSDKRRRNREHAKRSRMRKRVRLGGLEGMVLSLRRENVRLRQIVKQEIPERAEDILRACARDNTNADIVAKQDVVQGMRPGMSMSSSSRRSSRVVSRTRPKVEGGASHPGSGSSGDRRVPSALKLMSPCYQSVKALAKSQANFVLTNPNLPDCPIIFASQGFVELTGYEASQVVGKNCRFLQGPGTDPTTVSIVRNNLAAGRDTSVCVMNYKADGTPFWNQLSIGVLLDAQGEVANHVGVLCEVNQMPPAVFHRLLHRVPLPEGLLNDDESWDSGDASAGDKVSASSTRCITRSTRCAPAAVDRLRRTRAAAGT